MKFRSVRYLIKEGIKNICLNRLMSLASIGVLTSCLLMIGIALLFAANINKALGWMEQQNVFVVFVKDGADAEQAAEVGRKIKSIENVQQCEFVSKDEALIAQSNLLGEDSYLMSDLRHDNPLPDLYKVAIKDLKLFDQTINQIKSIENVGSVKSRHDIADKILQIRNLVATIGIWLFALLLIIALFIITNTIKITMFVRRLEINIMKSVGATSGFIRFPFIVEGIVLGFISALVTYGITWYIYRSIIISMIKGMSLSFVDFSEVSTIMLIGFIVIGVLIGAFGGFVSIRKYLKEEGGIYNVN